MEVDMLVPVYDFSGSILIHRSVIEELNGVIRQLGEQKILSMVESKEFRKGIVQLEWVQRKSQMRMEDLHNTAREIQMLKVTRDIQAFLNEEDYERKKSEETNVMMKTIAIQERRHRKTLKERKRKLEDYRAEIDHRSRENKEMQVRLIRYHVVDPLSCHCTVVRNKQE